MVQSRLVSRHGDGECRPRAERERVAAGGLRDARVSFRRSRTPIPIRVRAIKRLFPKGLSGLGAAAGGATEDPERATGVLASVEDHMFA